MISLEEIQRLAQRIADEFKPRRIILFGSYATGTPTEDSDVDLFIITPLQGRGCQKAAEIRLKVRPHFPVDLLVRSPREVQTRLGLGDFFVKAILEKGRVLYENDHDGVG